MLLNKNFEKEVVGNLSSIIDFCNSFHALLDSIIFVIKATNNKSLNNHYFLVV